MNTHDIKERQKKNMKPGKGVPPDPNVHTHDANVGLGGECIIPPHPESARADTGDPCDDGRGAGKD